MSKKEGSKKGEVCKINKCFKKIKKNKRFRKSSQSRIRINKNLACK